MENGTDAMDRTGTGTRSIFGCMLRFDLSAGFPAATTKQLAWRSVVSELLWFLEGSTDERRLAEFRYGKPREELIGKTTIWTDNADAQGKALGYRNDDTVKELGPVYGKQWRKWNNIRVYAADFSTDQMEFENNQFDQIKEVIAGIKRDPYGRRHLVSAWNPPEVAEAALPPCHYGFQFYVRDGKLSCMWQQRSADVPLGIPFNIASYALLTHIIARECKLQVGDLIGSLGDAHIYHNQIDQVKEQLTREPFDLPTLEIDPSFDLMDRLDNNFYWDDTNLFKLVNYQHHAAIKTPMAV